MHPIKNRWYIVLTPDEVPADKPVAFTRLGQEVVFWRDDKGDIVAALDICPHRRAKLSAGRIKDGCLECPFHGFRFNGEGVCAELPAHPGPASGGAMSLHTLPVRVAHGFVWLWTGPGVPRDDESIPFFGFASYSWGGSALFEGAETCSTRAIEG